MFWKRKEKHNTYQENLDRNIRETAEKVTADRKRAQEKRDIPAVLADMENFCKENGIVEFSVFVDFSRRMEKTHWLKALLNPSAAYYFRLWLASYKRIQGDAVQVQNAVQGTEMPLSSVPGLDNPENRDIIGETEKSSGTPPATRDTG